MKTIRLFTIALSCIATACVQSEKTPFLGADVFSEVRGPNQAPELQTGSGSTFVRTNMNYSVRIPIGVTDEDHLPSELTLEFFLDPENGRVDYEAGAVIYTPDRGYFGNDFFQFRISDPEGGKSEVAEVAIDIQAAGDRRLWGTFAHNTCVPNSAPFQIEQITTEWSTTFRARGWTRDCTIQVYDQFETGEIIVGNDIVNPEGETVTETEVIRTTFFITPISGQGANIMNNQNLCGFNDWRANEPKDLGPTGCSGVHGVGESQFGVAKFDFASPDDVRLHLVDGQGTGDGLTESTRWLEVRDWYLTRIAP